MKHGYYIPFEAVSFASHLGAFCYRGLDPSGIKGVPIAILGRSAQLVGRACEARPTFYNNMSGIKDVPDLRLHLVVLLENPRFPLSLNVIKLRIAINEI